MLTAHSARDLTSHHTTKHQARGRSTSTMPTTTTATTLCLLALLAAAVAAGGDGTTHLHFYIHETYAGANSTVAALATSPLAGGGGGNSSSFGGLGALDDEIREGSDAASRYLGRAEAFLVQADLRSPAASCGLLTLAFTDGDYQGSTLVVDGRLDLSASPAAAERAVVGGTGKFRRARGYSLTSKFSNAAPSVVFEMDVYVTTA